MDHEWFIYNPVIRLIDNSVIPSRSLHIYSCKYCGLKIIKNGSNNYRLLDFAASMSGKKMLSEILWKNNVRVA